MNANRLRAGDLWHFIGERALVYIVSVRRRGAPSKLDWYGASADDLIVRWITFRQGREPQSHESSYHSKAIFASGGVRVGTSKGRVG